MAQMKKYFRKMRERAKNSPKHGYCIKCGEIKRSTHKGADGNTHQLWKVE